MAKPIYPETAAIETPQKVGFNTRESASTFRSIGDIGAAVIAALSKRLGK